MPTDIVPTRSERPELSQAICEAGELISWIARKPRQPLLYVAIMGLALYSVPSHEAGAGDLSEDRYRLQLGRKIQSRGLVLDYTA